MPKDLYIKYNIFYLNIIILISINICLGIFLYLNRGCNRHVNMIAFLNIGQGDAIYIENKLGQSILIDTGNKDSDVLKQIQKVRLCYKVHISTLLLTHADQDHIGEAANLIKKGIVGQVIHNGFLDMDQKAESQTENELEKTIKELNILTQDMVVLPSFNFEYFDLRFLYPIEKPYQDKKGKSNRVDDNDYSIVLKLSHKDKSFMLTGDAPIKAEKQMIDNYCGKNVLNTCPVLESDILKLGHHGSKNSSGMDFLTKVGATDYIVSAGLNNKYRHPNEETLYRVNLLNKKDSRIRETFSEGNIVYLLN